MLVDKNLFYGLLNLYQTLYLNSKDDVEWITIKGNHIPIKKGVPKSQAIAEFFEKKKSASAKKQAVKTVNKDYQAILDKVKASNEKNLTADNILNELAKDKGFKYSLEEVKEKMAEAEAYNNSIKDNKKETYIIYKDKEQNYTEKRKMLHKEIIAKLFENKANAKPTEGKPTFIMLGGRGGSGKSKFDGLVYDRSKYIVLDADGIKEMLPEYRGYNAFEVHEESSEILNKALNKAKKLGLNVVLDATMKTEKSTTKKLNDFIDADYNIEMYYMHLPREKSTQRAIGRYMGANGRYVPMDVLLGMKNNEQTFDKLKKYASKWAFYNNDVASKDTPPILVAKSE